MTRQAHRLDLSRSGTYYQPVGKNERDLALLAAIGEIHQVSMDGRGRWLDSIFTWRLWWSIKYEHVYLKAYESISEPKESWPPTLTSTTKGADTRASRTASLARSTGQH